ncbi:hypothetical protein BD560DRAFT_438922 [Blakeslea trispora]|nr:hypothetical protein BD560DRAFT_438922 [Blakeslea trispora]
MLSATHSVESSLDAVWKSFKSKKTNAELFSEDAAVIFVPSSVGARGNADIRRFFLHPQFSDKVTSVNEYVFQTISSEYSLIEEAIWTVRFFTDECAWLLPGIDSRYLMNTSIKFPVTVSALFDTDYKIKLIRYFWDQACVLKQVRMITDKQKWPITAEQQADMIECPEIVRLVGLDGQPIETSNKKPEQDQQKGKHLAGRIFGSLDTKDQDNRPTRQNEPNRNIFTYQPPAERRLVASSNKLVSQFSFAQDDGSLSKKQNKSE